MNYNILKFIKIGLSIYWSFIDWNLNTIEDKHNKKNKIKYTHELKYPV